MVPPENERHEYDGHQVHDDYDAWILKPRGGSNQYRGKADEQEPQDNDDWSQVPGDAHRGGSQRRGHEMRVTGGSTRIHQPIRAGSGQVGVGTESATRPRGVNTALRQIRLRFLAVVASPHAGAGTPVSDPRLPEKPLLCGAARDGPGPVRTTYGSPRCISTRSMPCQIAVRASQHVMQCVALLGPDLQRLPQQLHFPRGVTASGHARNIFQCQPGQG